MHTFTKAAVISESSSLDELPNGVNRLLYSSRVVTGTFKFDNTDPGLNKYASGTDEINISIFMAPLYFNIKLNKSAPSNVTANSYLTLYI